MLLKPKNFLNRLLLSILGLIFCCIIPLAHLWEPAEQRWHFLNKQVFLALLQFPSHPFKVIQSNLENSPTIQLHISKYQVFPPVLLAEQLARQQSNFVVASPTDVSEKVRHRELSAHCESIYSFSPTHQSISSFKVQIRNTDVFCEKLAGFSF